MPPLVLPSHITLDEIKQLTQLIYYSKFILFGSTTTKYIAISIHNITCNPPKKKIVYTINDVKVQQITISTQKNSQYYVLPIKDEGCWLFLVLVIPSTLFS